MGSDAERTKGQIPVGGGIGKVLWGRNDLLKASGNLSGYQSIKNEQRKKNIQLKVIVVLRVFLAELQSRVGAGGRMIRHFGTSVSFGCS